MNLGLTAKKIAVCCGFDANDKVLRDLKFDSTVAKMLSEEFTKFLDERKPLVYTFQEGSAISGFGLISGKVIPPTAQIESCPLTLVATRLLRMFLRLWNTTCKLKTIYTQITWTCANSPALMTTALRKLTRQFST